MKINELRSESTAKLKELLSTIEAELYNLRNERAVKSEKAKPDQFRKRKKTIARVHTILRERELAVRGASV